MFYGIYVNYRDKFYSGDMDPLVRKLAGMYDYKRISDEEGVISHFLTYTCEMSETDEELKLKFNKINFNTDLLDFESIPETEYVFNKKTCEGTISKEVRICSLSNLSVNTFFNYIAKVASYNKNVYDFLNESMSGLERCFRRYSRENLIIVEVVAQNLLNLATTNLIEMEKLISSGNTEYLIDLLKTEGAKLEKGKKISQVVNLPKFALDYIKDNDLLSAKVTMQNIATEFDGNTLKIIIDMFDKFIPYEKYDSKRTSYWNNPTIKKRTFFENVYTLLGKKYKIVDLLNYLLKQRMYWSGENFNFPYEEAKLLLDYISICEKHSLKYEKYPQHLKKYHDIVLKNIEELNCNEDKKNDFLTAVKKYYTGDIEVDNYVFTAPGSIPELIAEGNSLHHCIGNYSDAIIEGISRIYFMREKGKERESFITLELNENNDLIEFKGDYNKEPSDPEVLKALNTFVKKVKKAAGGK